MLKAQMDYGAIATKVRALQGRLLTEADFQRLAAMGSVEEVVAFLRGSGAWREAMGSLPPGSVDAAAVERALREQLSEEYRRLYLFASSGDRKFLLFLLYRTEYSLILATLRRLFSPNSLPPGRRPPPSYSKRARRT